MYNQEIYARVGEWMENHKEEMIRDIAKLAAIPSISGEKEGDAPFGKACQEALEAMLEMGRSYGFHTENYENYVGSIGSRKKDWENTIGFWNHLDVVPVGDGWDYSPFEPARVGKYLIARGVQDNKGPAVGLLYVMRCLRDLKLPMKHELCLFVGCDEEKGMRDMEYYTAHSPTPAMSMIADCGFPVCFGEKGILEGRIRSHKTLSDAVVELSGGNAGNIIPDEAVMVLRREKLEEGALRRLPEALQMQEEGGLIRLTAKGLAGHSAFPEGSDNAIRKLCDAVCEAGLLTGGDRELLEGIRTAVAGNYGEESGIAYEDELSGRLTCAGTVLRLEEGHVMLTFNIRYSITADAEGICSTLTKFWDGKGFAWILERDSKPNYFNRKHPAVDKLTEVFNRMTGQQREPYVMGGGTYARKLPNAFGFGIGNMPGEDDSPYRELVARGHGGAHGPDEALDCDRLVEALKIYVMGLLALNDITLCMPEANTKA